MKNIHLFQVDGRRPEIVFSSSFCPDSSPPLIMHLYCLVRNRGNFCGVKVQTASSYISINLVWKLEELLWIKNNARRVFGPEHHDSGVFAISPAAWPMSVEWHWSHFSCLITLANVCPKLSVDCLLLIPLVHRGKGATTLWQSAGHWPELIWHLLSLFLFLQPSLARGSVKHRGSSFSIMWGREQKTKGETKTDFD